MTIARGHSNTWLRHASLEGLLAAVERNPPSVYCGDFAVAPLTRRASSKRHIKFMLFVITLAVRLCSLECPMGRCGSIPPSMN